MDVRRLFVLLMTLYLTYVFGQENGNVTAKPGQNRVILPCVAAGNQPVIVVKWWRADLGEQEYVLLYRDAQLDEDYQHPSFKDRVSLQDGEVRTANVSLVLRNVTAADRGTYKCEVAHKKPDGSNSDMKPISTVHLDVAHPPGNQDGSRNQGTKDGTNEGTSNEHRGLIAAVVFIFVLMLS